MNCFGWFMNINSKHLSCLHFKECSGCTLNEFVDHPATYQEACEFFKSKGLVNLPLYAGPANGWRLRAKLAVRGSSTNPHIGLFKERTHEVVDIPFCKVHHPSINKAIQFVKELIQTEKIVPYIEKQNKGDLRYLQIVVERKTGKVQLTLVLNLQEKEWQQDKHWHFLLKKLWERDPEFWHSIWINLNTTKTNVIFGSFWHLFCGESLLWEKFEETSVCFQPSSFAQANLDAFEKMLGDIKKYVPENSVLVDYYCGVGVIGLSLVKKCQQVFCCEINPFAQYCFEKSKQKLPDLLARKISFHTGKAADFGHLLDEADTVIVDPPRKGIEPSLIKDLSNAKKVNNFIYVSCNWQSFKRDYELLLDSNWRLKEAQAYLFFPGSDHIELLSNFCKKT